MRRLLPAFLLALMLPAAAQQPPKLQPLPELPPPPPPPPNVAADSDAEPQVTIKQNGENKEEEYRVNGRLYMIKVTPPHGVPYYLVDDAGSGMFTRRDTMGPNVKPPMWVIKTF